MFWHLYFIFSIINKSENFYLIPNKIVVNSNMIVYYNNFVFDSTNYRVGGVTVLLRNSHHIPTLKCTARGRYRGSEVISERFPIL